MPQKSDAEAKRILRGEMVRKGVSYDQLVGLLAEIGAKETSASLRNKLSRGSFTADFFLDCLTVMGVKTLHLGE